MTSPAALQRFESQFYPYITHGKGLEIKAFLSEELDRREAEVLEQIEEISEFLSEDSLQRVLMHYKKENE